VRRVGRLLKRRRAHRISATDLRSLARLLWRLPGAGPGVRRQFWRTVLDCLIHNPTGLPYLVMMMALYLHLGPFSRRVIADIDRQIADGDRARWIAPAALPVPELVPEAIFVPA